MKSEIKEWRRGHSIRMPRGPWGRSGAYLAWILADIDEERILEEAVAFIKVITLASLRAGSKGVFRE